MLNPNRFLVEVRAASGGFRGTIWPSCVQVGPPPPGKGGTPLLAAALSSGRVLLEPGLVKAQGHWGVPTHFLSWPPTVPFEGRALPRALSHQGSI